MSPDPADPTLPRPLDAREVELARMSVAAPAIFIIINGFLGLVIMGLLWVPCVYNPNLLIDTWDDLIANLPPGPEKQKAEQQLADARKELDAHHDEIVFQNALILLGLGALNVLAIVGGLCLRRLSNYTFSMIGGIVSVIPIATGCCFSGIPFGIWVLVVLNRPEIKAAFLARRNAVPPNPDEQYLH